MIPTFCTVSGTLRSNLDPFGLHDDARLWDALKRAYLVEDRKPDSLDGEDSNGQASRFTLDSTIEDEGGNLSIGQVCIGRCIRGQRIAAGSCIRSVRSSH